MGASVRQASPFFIDIALPVIENRHHGGLGQHRFGFVATLQPAIRFLLLDRQLLVVGSLALGPAPDLRVRQTETFLCLGIHRYDWMDEQPGIGTISNPAEPALAPALCLVIDLACVLDRQYMPTRCGSGHEHRSMRDHFFYRDRIVREKALKLDLLGAIVREITQTYRLPFNDPLRDQFAIFLQSGISKISNSRVHRRPLFDSRRHRQNHARFGLGKPNRTAINESQRTIH